MRSIEHNACKKKNISILNYFLRFCDIPYSIAVKQTYILLKPDFDTAEAELCSTCKITKNEPFKLADETETKATKADKIETKLQKKHSACLERCSI